MKENKEKSNDGIAYLIEFQDRLQMKDLSPDMSFNKLLDRNHALKRRALSPQANNTYIALSNVAIKKDRYQEEPVNLKFKHIKACIKLKDETKRRSANLFNWLKNANNDWKEFENKNEVCFPTTK